MAFFREIASLFRIRVDDERAVEPLVNMPLQRAGVAVIKMKSERLSREFIRVLIADCDLATPNAGDAIMKRAVNAMKVHRVRMRAGVREMDPEQVPLVGAKRRTWHPAVVGP